MIESPPLKRWNAAHLQLSQGLLGAISPNVRAISLTFEGGQWMIRFYLERSSRKDVEELGEALTDFEAIDPSIAAPYGFEYIVHREAIDAPPPPGRLVFLKRNALAPIRRTLHVVFGLSAAGSIREALKRIDRPDKVVGLIDDFSCGPTDSSDMKARQAFDEDVLGYDLEDEDVRKMRKAFWRKSLDPKQRRIVWLSRWSAIEYCNFLVWLEQNGDAPFDLVDLTDTSLPGHRDPSVFKPVMCTALVGAEQFVQHQLWDRAVPFSEQQRSDSMRLWGRLRSEDAPLRVITPAGLVSAPIEQFDADLLSRVNDDWTDARQVVGRTMVAAMYDSFREGGVYQCGDLLLFSRVRSFVEAGVLKKKGRLYSATFKVRRPQTG